jgi:translation initiation factor eIF-2B subunit delta
MAEKSRQRQEKKKQEEANLSAPQSLSTSSGGGEDKLKEQFDKQMQHKSAEIQRLQTVVDQQSVKLKENRIYSHLEPYKNLEQKGSLSINDERYHPAIVRLGLQYSNGSIRGANARCVAFMTTLKQVVLDYKTPEDKVLTRDLDSALVPQIDFLKKMRPMSIGMGNALKSFKVALHSLDPRLPENEAKEKLAEFIDDWISERIQYTILSIVEKGVQRIKNGDVILTYARSEVVEKILLEAKAEGKDFSVVIVNSRPKNEGKELLHALSEAGIKCTFVMINAVSYMMKEVTTVMLGAQAMLSNGTVKGRVGTAMICMTARSFHKPVLVCCETYKFSDKSQLDSLTRNEISKPEELTIPDREDVKQRFIKSGLYANNQYANGASVLNLTYDVTPGEWIDVVVTEVGLLPCTSVPVVLREFFAQSS